MKIKTNLKRVESKIKPSFQFFKEEAQTEDLRSLDSNLIINKLEESIKLRDLSAKKRFEMLVKK